MKIWRFRWLLVLVLLTVSCVWAQVVNDVPPRPSGPAMYITDLADLLTPEDQQALLPFLQDLDHNGKTQIAIVTIPNTDRELSELAPDILNQWGVGHKDRNDGLVILANADRIRNNRSGNRIFVATGTGIQGLLPDAVVGRILDNEAIPRFEAGQYSTGIREATVAYGKILDGDPTAKEKYAPEQDELNWPIIVFVLIFLMLMFRWNRNYGGGGGFYVGGGDFGGGGSDFGGGGGDFGGGGGDGGGAGR